MAKNIVLLADGTGNSEASPFKTNVWRLYQAVDICQAQPGQPEQVVFYDNGVGTETFKPLQVLGLALGIGVARNVKNLYTFLCRNYQEGDNIFLFGFSRGAFTVRILAGLILRCGVVTAPSEQELEQRVKLAYAEYKRDAARRATQTRPWLIAGRVLGGSQSGRVDRISFNFPHHFPRIAFMGVWDTVDAYGMPIDELKEGIDRYVWPMTLADRGLSDHIDRVCHALSLDDERPTFRPVLWTDPATKPERLSQVWFAGVHANVGGGYPDDGLACVSLQWIMDEAAEHGLRFDKVLRTQYEGRADPHGEQYDSRSGLGGYYRYGPRDMDALCDDPDHGVKVRRPQIHDSVVQRIRHWQVAYAPHCVSNQPRGYDLYGRSDTAPYLLIQRAAVETDAEVRARAEGMQFANDAVFRRAVAYFSTVAFTVVLAVLPVFDWIAEHVWPSASGWLDRLVPTAFRLLIAPFSALAWLGDELARIPGWSWTTTQVGNGLNWLLKQDVLPGWVKFWVESFAQHPALFLFCGLVVLWLFVRKSQMLQDQVFARADYAWRHLRAAAAHTTGKNKGQAARPESAWSDPIVRWLRSNKVLVAIYDWFTGRLVPLLFAIFVAAPIGALILPIYIPKFLRNRRRRRKYAVELRTDRIERVPGIRVREERAAA